jgi:cytochrome c553/WD40 repeat protein
MRCIVLVILSVAIGVVGKAFADGPALYQKHCAECHGAARLGGMGPALLPENLKRLRKKKALKVIANGRPATQMPAFSDQLNDAEIGELAKFIYTPLAEIPTWTEKEIAASQEVYFDADTLPSTPQHKSDPLNLFTVVEAGDHHVTILDGDNFEAIWRFQSRFALHGGAKYSPDGRFMYLGSRDGWVSKFDLHNLKMIAEVRAGVNMRNIAISSDGKILAAANYLPHSIAFLNAEDLAPLATITVGTDGETSRVSAIYQATPRGSFIAALKDLPEIWEIPYDGITKNIDASEIRRIKVDRPLDDFFFDPPYRHVVGADRKAEAAIVVDLDSGLIIKELPLPGLPHLGSGISWMMGDRRVMATPHLKGGALSIIDLQDWKITKSIKTKGPGFFLRSHENSKYAWADVFFGPNKDLVHVIDKQSLEIVKTLKPAPGKVAAHTEFTRDGKYVLLSIWDMDGALVIYDAETLVEIKRIPMIKPSGKYNVYNKTRLSEGTSH